MIYILEIIDSTSLALFPDVVAPNVLEALGIHRNGSMHHLPCIASNLLRQKIDLDLTPHRDWIRLPGGKAFPLFDALMLNGVRLILD